MNSSTDWSLVSGFNTEGTVIRKDLDLLVSGKMDDEEISELLTEFVRDGDISSSAIPSFKYLMLEHTKLSPESRLNCLYTACLILGHAQKRQTALILPEEHTFESLRNQTLRKLFYEAFNHDLSIDWMVSIAAVILLLQNDELSYKSLVRNWRLI